MDTPRNFEQLSDLDLMAVYWEHFGAVRGVGILGWCAVASLSGADNPVELRQRLEARGMTNGSIYRALNDLRAFREKLEGAPLPRRDSRYAIAMMRRLHSVAVL